MKNVNVKSSFPLYLSALGVACSLGLGKKAVSKSLYSGQQNSLKFKETLISGKTVFVGRVPFDLPDLPQKFEFLNSRNNRLLKLTLDEIAVAVENAKEKFGKSRIGVVLGTSSSGMLEGEKAFTNKLRTGVWPENYHYAQQEIASPSIFTSQYFSLDGPSYTVSTACSAASKAICSARRLINTGICDAVITGGVESLCQLVLNGFDSLDLLSEKICSPFSKNRNGITIGEGAAVFLMTREKNSDGLAIEFLGGGESSDSYHISSPDPSGAGAAIAIKEALAMASVKVDDIGYINLHGTATFLNDAMESGCINRIFGESTPCSSTKALTGHTLGAAGAIEAAFLWLALSQEQSGTIPIPPHTWDGEWDKKLASIHLSKFEERISFKKGRFALMSNSFAFGGSNASLILGKNSEL